MSEVRIRYAVTRRSLLAGLRASTDFPKMALVMAAAFGGVMLLTGIGKVHGWASTTAVWVWLGGSLLAGLSFGVIMSAVSAFVLLPMQARRLFSQNPLLYGEMALNADDEHLAVTGPRSSVNYKWTDLRGFKETDRVFVIALSRSVSFAIPKPGMPAATQEAFRALLDGRLRRLRGRGLR